MFFLIFHIFSIILIHYICKYRINYGVHPAGLTSEASRSLANNDGKKCWLFIILYYVPYIEPAWTLNSTCLIDQIYSILATN